MPSTNALEFANVLGAGTKTLLANIGFRVADFRFDHLLRDGRLRKLVESDFASEDAAKVLLYAPELFVMHSKLDPAKGVFFVKCASTSDEKARSVMLSKEEFETYKRFYPTRSVLLMVGRRTDPPEILAGWLNELNFKREGRHYVASTRRLSSFEAFMKKKFGMDIGSEDLKNLQTELAKLR